MGRRRRNLVTAFAPPPTLEMLPPSLVTYQKHNAVQCRSSYSIADMKFISKLICNLNNYRADPTNAFIGKGIRKAFQLFISKPAYQHAFQCLGSDFLIED